MGSANMRLLMIEMRHFLNKSERTRAADNCVLVSNKIKRGAAPLLP
nr:MAG TPA: hypothetical protein [Caudoviricetes sp.]